ncbi:alpha/beta-type small acid-soluble spore protein [Effusibacillus dendaii]|uniref:Small acid-soluble spore protein n=1 Tax=Effusibacillus dendaii TaxID=2743772 RepID=A0A7I8DEP7_9BACL|nr:alpha/beta-type small acid-soluble spore protein [Effusibacillus dendaii]BCJ88594.1 small acid-soluble spore protein [Effusibacillus dendaii]
MARRRNRLLVPEAQASLDRLKCELIRDTFGSPSASCAINPNDVKYEAAEEVGVPLVHGDNGDLTARQAGKVGGKLGGAMVRHMIEMAKQQMADTQQTPDR